METKFYSLFTLDHMRNKASYSKKISKWCEEYNINGRLFFTPKRIFILLEGDKNSIKEWTRLMKTTNVDVDSKGRPCKERLLTTIQEGVLTKDTYSNFEIEELKDENIMDVLLKEHGINLS
jgi:hypothetical protein